MYPLNLDAISQTAIIVNQLKAEHYYKGAYPKIYADPISVQLAQVLANQSVLKAYQSLSSDLIKAAQSCVLLRSRYVYDQFLQLAAQGIDQYIMLGAGLDCFAYQKIPELEPIQIFELDRWNILSAKEELLTQCLHPKPLNIHFCPVDFKTDDIRQALTTHDYNTDKPCLASLLGVSQYIEFSILESIFKAMLQCKAGSRLILSYIVTSENLDDKEAKLLAEFEQIARASGEPFISRFHPQDFVQQLKDMGFSSVKRFMPDQAQKQYFFNRIDGLHANSVEQVIEVTV